MQGFIDNVVKQLFTYKELGDKTLALLSEEDIHYSPNRESNSIAMIIQHLHGNMMSRFTNFLIEDGEKPWRRRDEEFAAHSVTKEKAIAL